LNQSPTGGISPTEDWIREATQARSRRTEAAIRVAAAGLLRTTPFKDISVAQIAERADISVGGFYRRFRDKRAVLLVVYGDFIEDCRVAFDRELSDEAVGHESLEGIARAYVTLMVTKFREHRETILQVMKNSDPRDDGEFSRRRSAFNHHVHGRFRELLRGCGAEITHPEPELALNLAIFFASSAARDTVWRNNLRGFPIDIEDGALIEEIVRAFVAYLRS